MHVHVRYDRDLGPVVPFLCPSCHQVTEGQTSSVREIGKLLFVIPFWYHSNHYVQCMSCGDEFRSALDPQRLARMAPQAIHDLVNPGLTTTLKALVIAAPVLALVPVVGLAVSLLAAVLARRCRKGYRLLLVTALCVSLAISLSTCLVILKEDVLGRR